MSKLTHNDTCAELNKLRGEVEKFANGSKGLDPDSQTISFPKEAVYELIDMGDEARAHLSRILEENGEGHPYVFDGEKSLFPMPKLDPELKEGAGKPDEPEPMVAYFALVIAITALVVGIGAFLLG